MADEKSAPTDSLAIKIQTVRVWLVQQESELARALPKGMDPTRFARVALTAVLRQPKLADCTRASFVLAIMEAAQLGLEPDSVSGLAYLVPYGTTCQLIVGYRGMIQLAYHSPRVIAMSTECVYEKDGFDVELGLRPKLLHKPAMTGGRGEIIGAYATALIRGGGHPFVWMPRDEIDAHRARSRAKDAGPWVTDYAAMAKKTPVRALAKLIPQSPQLMQALAVDADPELEPAPGSPAVPNGSTPSELLDALAAAEEGEPR